MSLKNVFKYFGEFRALNDVSLEVAGGERVVVCGPSGSGKSTMIRCINRLEEHDDGEIWVNKNELTEDTRNIAQIRKDIGMVFQQFNLFPHLSVVDNLTLAPMKARGLSKKDSTDLAMTYLNRVHIPEQAMKYPGQLSGGQQQRVCLLYTSPSPRD